MKKWISKWSPFLNKHVGLELLFNGFILTLVVEALNRRSLSGAFSFLTGSFHTFFCNVLIVTLTLCVSLFCGKWRGLVEMLISLVWLVLGITNFVILGYRMTPFSAEDIKLVKLAMQISRNYLTPITVAGFVLGIIALIVLVILLISKFPRETTHRSLFSVVSKTAAVACALYVFVTTGMQTSALSETFENLAEAYEDYGFAYCFSNSIVDVGISKPGDYSQERMEQIAQQIRSGMQGKDASEVKTPNIIMIQLESFFDPDYMIGYSFSEDPIPTFRSLKESCASGFLTVPVVGAGTANTEFEAITGMSTEYFGAGEYPYNTVLGSTTCESLPHILRQSGYASSVIHNHRGTFYKRNNVFSKLGFDRFIPREYLYDLSYTPTGWARDEVLSGTIMDAMAATEQQDFVYVITVQSHGRYPAEKTLEDPAITVSCEDEEANIYPVEYYVNQLREVDDMVKDLIARIEESAEPTVLVLYGDHLPALGYRNEDLSMPSLYFTEYVIWDNLGLDLADEDIGVESLGSKVLGALGLTSGIIPQFHAVFDGTEDYYETLDLLEYDMLYGEGYVFAAFADELPAQLPEEGPLRAYEPTDLTYGLTPVTVTKCEVTDGELYVYGDGFNEASRIVLDGKIKSTTFIDCHTLLMNASVPEGEIDQLRVLQCDPDDEEMGEGSNVLLQVDLN